MFSDHPLAEEELLLSIRKDVCGRNKDLASLIKIINYASSSSSIIALDGEWGTGKTFLIKQLELLWKRDDNPLINSAVSDTDLKSIRNTLIPIYYNAWENDYAPDATQSLLSCLSESLNDNKHLILKTGRSLAECIDVISFIKNATHDLIEASSFNEGKMISNLAPETSRTRKLREAISSLIDEKIKLQAGCKLLFIIDDLDRCRPSYAISLIESIKNCFNNGRVLFLIATNFSELGNIIRGYYGGYIDGHRYLDRIFDLKLNLSSISQCSYIKYKCPRMDTWAISNVATALKLNMRELNHLLNIATMYEAYFKSESYFIRDRKFFNICRFIFIPIFIGYRIKNYSIYTDLTSHNGRAHIANYFSENPSMEKYAKRLLANDDAPSKIPVAADNTIEKYYDMLFSSEEAEKAESDEYFWNILNLTSDMISLNNE